MDAADSLDWFLDDFYSFNPADAIREFDDDYDYDHDDDDYCNVYGDDDGNDGDRSDDSSDLSDISCSLLVGDKETAQQLNEIVNEIKNEFKGESDDDDYDNVAEEFEGADYESAVNTTFYIDALETAKKLLSKVNLVWTDTLYRCMVNEYVSSIPGDL